MNKRTGTVVNIPLHRRVRGCKNIVTVVLEYNFIRHFEKRFSNLDFARLRIGSGLLDTVAFDILG